MNILGTIFAVITSVSLLGPAFAGTAEPERFALPEEARLLVVAEGQADSDCIVSTYEKQTCEDGSLQWKKVMAEQGMMGRSGLSSSRTEGDGTTPIGVWMLNTPFGQKPAEEGFPSDYVQVDGSWVWSETSNRLERNTDAAGEKVGSADYAGYYDYVLDMGYNRNAVKGKGSALFIHCQVEGSPAGAGCVRVSRDYMKELMKLYGKYGNGACFIAVAPMGKTDKLYNAYGANNGLSPDGDF